MPLVSGAVECRSYGADDVEGTSFSFLRVGPGTVCEGGVPPPAVWAWGWVCIALWPIGVPATFATILVSCRHAIVAHQPFRVPLAVASRFLYREYRAHLYLWEVWELLRRLALTGFVLLVPEKHELMRLLAALVISLLSLTALLLLRPYKAADNQAVAVGTQLSATLFFIGATYLKLWADLAAGPLGEAYAAEVLGVDAVDWLAVVAHAQLRRRRRRRRGRRVAGVAAARLARDGPAGGHGPAARAASDVRLARLRLTLLGHRPGRRAYHRAPAAAPPPEHQSLA
jgi:hypothetical protein